MSLLLAYSRPGRPDVTLAGPNVEVLIAEDPTGRTAIRRGPRSGCSCPPEPPGRQLVYGPTLRVRRHAAVRELLVSVDGHTSASG
jgi:hypothetical protein